MRERPMLFNGAMVRAILAGQKTQTRRAVAGVRGDNCLTMRKPTKTKAGIVTHVLDAAERGLCPFGQTGDRLWVRETWAQHPDYPDARRAVYRADPGAKYDSERWRPSIHMPRWACRLLLDMTAVRVERLHAISDADALAEGIEELNGRYTHNGGKYECRSPAGAFVQLWKSTAGDWDSNPWVWVIEFKVVTNG